MPNMDDVKDPSLVDPPLDETEADDETAEDADDDDETPEDVDDPDNDV